MFNGPSNLTYKKYHKLKLRCRATELSFFCPKFGDFALKNISIGKINAKHIEAGRRIIRRTVKKQASIKINIFPYAAFTKKPTAARMGKGKGKHAGWFCPVKKGRILYELSSSNRNWFKISRFVIALNRANYKLPVKSKVLKLVY